MFMLMKKIGLIAALMGLSACTIITDRDLMTGSTGAGQNALASGTWVGGTWAGANWAKGKVSGHRLAPSLSNEINPNYAIAYLPSVAGNIQTVRQQSGRDRIHQTVLYPTTGHGSGENQIIIDVAKVKGNNDYIHAPTRRQIQQELKRFFPKMPMTIDELPGENLYGIYGYAYGTSKIDGNCIFAWQVISDVSRRDLDEMKNPFQANYRAKLRVRYCHPTKSKDQLLVLMNGFRVKPVTSATMEILRFSESTGYAASQAPQTAVETIKPVPAKTQSVAKKVVTPAKIEKPLGPRVLLPQEFDPVADQATDIVAVSTPVIQQTSSEATTALLIPMPD